MKKLILGLLILSSIAACAHMETPQETANRVKKKCDKAYADETKAALCTVGAFIIETCKINPNKTYCKNVSEKNGK